MESHRLYDDIIALITIFRCIVCYSIHFIGRFLFTECGMFTNRFSIFLSNFNSVEKSLSLPAYYMSGLYVIRGNNILSLLQVKLAVRQKSIDYHTRVYAKPNTNIHLHRHTIHTKNVRYLTIQFDK